jgi:hypothetical protein
MPNMNRNPEGKGGFKDNPQNRNTTGTPAYETFKSIIDRYSIKNTKELMELELDSLMVKHVIVINQIKKAIMDGDQKIVAWLADRSDGKAIETVKQETIAKQDVSVNFQ